MSEIGPQTRTFKLSEPCRTSRAPDLSGSYWKSELLDLNRDPPNLSGTLPDLNRDKISEKRSKLTPETLQNRMSQEMSNLECLAKKMSDKLFVYIPQSVLKSKGKEYPNSRNKKKTGQKKTGQKKTGRQVSEYMWQEECHIECRI